MNNILFIFPRSNSKFITLRALSTNLRLIISIPKADNVTVNC